jgi:hypothetical protein
MTETESGRRRMRLRTRLLLIAAAVVLVCGAMLAAFLLGLRRGGQEETPVITSDLLGERLRSAQELVTVAYYYTNMGRFENHVDFYGWKVPLTTKSFIVSYDGVIKAGVDLGGVEVEVDETGKTVTVTLPDSGILSHEIPEDSIEVFDESDNIFNPITIEDYTGFTRDEKTAMEQRAIDNGLLTSADEQARSAVESLLRLMPGMESYQLNMQ